MKRWLLAISLLFLAPLSRGQNPTLQGWCESGAQPVVTSGLTSSTQVQQSFPACTVTVFVHGGGLATIFSDVINTPLSNPFTASSIGRWLFYVAAGRYDVQLSGAGFPSPVTYSDLTTSSGGGGGSPPGGAANSLQKNSGSNTFAATSISDNGTNVVFGSETVLPTASANVSLKPATTNGIQYVSPVGSDSNDGFSWGTAKLTIYNALLALPGAIQSPPRAGTGTVYIGENSNANPTSGAGIWIMGSIDPNFASPPAGWIQAPSGVLPLQFIGVGCQRQSANQPVGQCTINAGTQGGLSDNNHPAIWLSGFANPELFQSLAPLNAAKTLVIGVCSNGDRTGTCPVVNQQFTNMQTSSYGKVGNGPGIDIGSGNFNIRFDHLWANSQSALIASGFITATGLSRTSNVVTATLTAATTTILTGDNCGITGANDTSFNFSAKNVTVGGGGTTITLTQPNPNQPNATSGGGSVFCDRAMPFVIDPGTGLGSGLIWINDFQFNGGGARIWSGAGSSFFMKDGYTENGDSPVVWYVGPAFNSIVSVDNVQAADQVTPPFGAFPPTMKIEVNGDPRNSINTSSDNFKLSLPAGQSVYIEGPITLIGASDQNGSRIPLQFGQQGVLQGHLAGQTDVGRSSPQTARYVNLAPTSSASWSSSGTGATVTTGIADRDGGTGAAQATTTGGGVQSIQFVSGTPGGLTTLVGDWFICGAWVRSLNSFTAYQGAKYSGSPSFAIACNVTTGTFTTSPDISMGAPIAGDGEWEWMWHAFKIASQSVSANIQFGVSMDSGHGVQVYSPVLVHIPVGTISDNEVLNLASTLRGYSNTNCSVGLACDTLGAYARTAYAVPSATTSANIATTTMTTAGASGAKYAFSATATQVAAGTSCTTNTTVNLQVNYTDAVTSAGVTVALGGYSAATNTFGNNASVLAVNNGNASQMQIMWVPITINAKASTAVQYQTIYTAGGGCSPAPTYYIQPVLTQVQ